MIIGKIAFPRSKVQAFCKKYKVKKFSFFGSVLTDRFGPESDIDILVEFEQDAHPTYFTLYDMETDLTDLFGRRTDVRTPNEISRYYRDQVLSEAKLIYASP